MRERPRITISRQLQLRRLECRVSVSFLEARTVTIDPLRRLTQAQIGNPMPPAAVQVPLPDNHLQRRTPRAILADHARVLNILNGRGARFVGRYFKPVQKGSNPKMTNRLRLPRTIDDAVDLLLKRMPQFTKAAIALMSDDYRIWLHMDFGNCIRNEFGLCAGNRALLEATDQQTADDASWVIIEALWRRLKTEVHRVESMRA